MGRARRHAWAWGTLLACVLATCDLTGCATVRTVLEPPASSSDARSLAVASLAHMPDVGSVGHACYAQVYHALVVRRVKDVNVVVRAPLAFGPWQARDDFDAEEASDAGEITQWLLDYFITHDWSAYGQQILAMQPGDRLTLNGRTMLVDGVYDYPKDAVVGEVLEMTGETAVVLQTCEPDTDYNRIVYGHYLDS